MQHNLLLQNEVVSPLGRLRLVGEIRGGRGVVPADPLRVYGAYAVVCITRGAGEYRDANGLAIPVTAGQAILVFPELAHQYRPPRGRTWDEFYVTFDGPAFDLWRQAGLFSPSRPVLSYTPEWFDAFRRLLTGARRTFSGGARTRLVCDFIALLNPLLLNEETGIAPEDENSAPEWRARACGMLEIDLGLPQDLTEIAAEVGMSYESFRKRFQKEVGVSPARYRRERRLAAARELLRYSPQMTNRQIAEMLGFADEYHFSRRFTEWAGVTPRAFRQGRI
jgi:AraC-like DNA-binding protein